MDEGIVIRLFRAAFPNHFWITRPRSAYTRLEFEVDASVYFRFNEHGSLARINLTWARNFSEVLQLYLRNQRVPDDGRDYTIGPEHVDRVIAILRNNP